MMSTQHNINVSVCVYMYSYVHIKAQTYIESYMKRVCPSTEKSRRGQKATQRVREETGQKSGKAVTKKIRI